MHGRSTLGPLLVVVLFIATVIVGACEKPVDRASPESPGSAPGAARPAATAPPPGDPGEPNAARRYVRIVDELGPSFMDPFSEFYDMSSLTPEVEAALERRQPQIRALVEASRIEACDFGTDYGDGPATLLPHLSKIRSMTRLLRADALRLSRRQRRVEAAERIAAIVRIARHVGGGRIVIEKLVGLAVLSNALQTIEELDDKKVIDARGAPIILAALRRIDVPDPFDARGAVEDERQIMVAAIRNDRGMEVMLGTAWSHLSSPQRTEIERDFDDAMRRFTDAWDRPEELEKIEASVKNPMVRMLLASIPRFREQVARASDRLEETIASLAPLASPGG